MTLRLARAQAEELEAIAQVENVPVAEVVRSAIAAHVETRRKDQRFQRRLREQLARNRRILEKLRSR